MQPDPDRLRDELVDALGDLCDRLPDETARSAVAAVASLVPYLPGPLLASLMDQVASWRAGDPAPAVADRIALLCRPVAGRG